jgi:FAD:protein FMN transferase
MVRAAGAHAVVPMTRPSALYAIAFRAMGSQFNVWLETPDDGQALLQAVPDWVETIEARLSRFRPDSELSRLNARSGRWVEVSETLLNAVLKARQAAQLTAGLYNPLVLQALLAAGYTRDFAAWDRVAETGSAPAIVPDWRGIDIKPKHSAIRLPPGAQIDLGGTGKGWTAEHIANLLAPHGPCLVDAGGDLVARGTPEGRPGWLVGVSEPGPASDSMPPVAAVAVSNAAIATSGIDFRRWTQGGQQRHHLIDPRTGQPAETDVLAATVIHPDAALAEGYTKALILMGSAAGLDWINRQPQRAALIVRRDRAVLATSDFEAHMVATA